MAIGFQVILWHRGTCPRPAAPASIRWACSVEGLRLVPFADLGLVLNERFGNWGKSTLRTSAGRKRKPLPAERPCINTLGTRPHVYLLQRWCQLSLQFHNQLL